jgi:hypothetical protein
MQQKFSNRSKLPAQIVSAVINDPYNMHGHLTATSLIQPPRMRQLTMRHKDEIVIDVEDSIWSLLGQTAHSILERAEQSGSFHEERIHADIDGITISCQTDVYCAQEPRLVNGAWAMDENGALKLFEIEPTIRDYKLIKVIAGAFKHPEWEQQLNINAHIWELLGFPVKRLEVIAIYRDWSKILARREREYPPPVQVFPIELWSRKKRDEYVRARVYLHAASEKLEDDQLPYCMPQEQWRRPPQYAVNRMSRKSAVRLFKTDLEAQNFILNSKSNNKMWVTFRPGEAVRCEEYCNARPFCNQYKIEHGGDYEFSKSYEGRAIAEGGGGWCVGLRENLIES